MVKTILVKEILQISMILFDLFPGLVGKILEFKALSRPGNKNYEISGFSGFHI
jgi:hypothetical protein